MGSSETSLNRSPMKRVNTRVKKIKKILMVQKSLRRGARNTIHTLELNRSDSFYFHKY